MNIRVNLQKNIDDSYNVNIGALEPQRFKKAMIVSNPTVLGLHYGYLSEKISAEELYITTIPDGEEHKSLSTVEYILDRMFEHRFDRNSVLVAFGGGVIGDMTGFTASIFERGCDFVQIPTTLLSAVDASVGGKTGVNNRFGKNLVGSFHQPKSVSIDPYFFKTLKPREFAAGVAEVVKMAVMFDGEFFGFLEENDIRADELSLLKAVHRSVELKAMVVGQDEKEHGIRAVLNYGHTFAHVIESETGYKKYLHGEAVAIGMCMANELACRLGLMDENEKERVKALLQKYSLPTDYKISDINGFYDKFFFDKKTKGGKLTFILPSGIGGHQIASNTDEAIVKEGLNAFLG